MDLQGRAGLLDRMDPLHLTPARITGIYVVFGFLLLGFSDLLLPALVAENALLRQLQGLKGAIEVVLTGGVIYVLISQYEKERDRVEATYRNLLANSPAPINLFDEDGKTVWGNDAVLSLLGLEDREELIGRPIYDFIHSEYRSTAETELKAVVHEDAKVGPTNFELIRDDGKRRQVRINTSSGWFDGQRVGQAVVNDLTDLRETESELRAERDFIDHALDELRDVFFVIDTEGRFVRWNEQLVLATGYDEAELETLSAVELVAPEDAGRVERAITTALESGQAFVEADLVSADGTRRPYEVKSARFEGRQGRTRIVGIGRDLTERKRLEREREENERRYRTLVEMSPDAIVVHQDGEIAFSNDAAVELLGADRRDDLIEVDIAELVPAEYGADVEEQADLIQRGEVGPSGNEWPMVGLDGSESHVEAISRPIAYDGEPAVLTVLRDVSDRHEYERQLRELHEYSRAMTLAEDRDSTALEAVRSIVDVLDLDGAAFYGLADDGVLQPVHSIRIGDRESEMTSTGRTKAGPIWEAFTEGEDREIDVKETASAVGLDGFGTAMLLPTGNHGVLIAGWANDRSFSATQRELANLLEQNLRAALDREERATTLQHRDRQLERQNRLLERLDRLNEVIRGVNQTLVRSTTRSEIESGVCEELAKGPRYSFAWMGAPDTIDESIQPSHWYRMDQEYVEYLQTTSGQSPVAALVEAAYRDNEVRFVNDVLNHADWTNHRSVALNYGYRSVAAVPVVVGDRVESVLVVHAEAADAFADEQERAVLAELGETIGYAIRTIERSGAVQGDERVELELELGSDRLLFNRLADSVDGRVEFIGSLPVEGEQELYFIRVIGQPTDVVLESIESNANIHSVEVIAADDDQALYRLTAAEPALFRALRARRAWLDSLESEAGTTMLTAVLPESEGVRALVEELQSTYEGTELVARRDRPNPIETSETFRAQLLDALTEKQHRALQTARFGGYYEWPRTSSSEQLAATLDIAPSTFQYHLRAAERKLVEQVLL